MKSLLIAFGIVLSSMVASADLTPNIPVLTGDVVNFDNVRVEQVQNTEGQQVNNIIGTAKFNVACGFAPVALITVGDESVANVNLKVFAANNASSGPHCFAIMMEQIDFTLASFVTLPSSVVINGLSVDLK